VPSKQNGPLLWLFCYVLLPASQVFGTNESINRADLDS